MRSVWTARGVVRCVDGSYVDPLGPQIERPRTAARRRDHLPAEISDEFNNEQIGDDLLPD